MRKKLWIHLALLLIIPGLLFTASCAKKTVKSDTSAASVEEQEAATEAAQAKEQQAAAEAAQMAEDNAARDAMMLQNMFESENIYFEFDSAALSPVAQGTLSGKADYLRDNPGS